jgi:2',3'-cyclic-nucleotide 2'-phosphodiesterase (5'-nucleotidase family)
MGAVVLAVALGAAFGAADVLGRTTGPLDARDAREAESTFGNMVADAARSAVGANAALVQASQLRPEVISPGQVTRQALRAALLYPDEHVVLVELTGAQIKEAIERGLSVLPKPSASLLHVSGLSVTFRSDLPAGQRIVGLALGEKPVSPDKSYKVAMPVSLAKGALGYFRIFKDLEPKDGPAIGEATADYVRSMQTVSPQTGRLRDLARPNG